LLCAKAKRQQQSAQSERKSTTRFGDDSKSDENVTNIKIAKNELILGGSL